MNQEASPTSPFNTHGRKVIIERTHQRQISLALTALGVLAYIPWAEGLESFGGFGIDKNWHGLVSRHGIVKCTQYSSSKKLAFATFSFNKLSIIHFTLWVHIFQTSYWALHWSCRICDTLQNFHESYQKFEFFIDFSQQFWKLLRRPGARASGLGSKGGRGVGDPQPPPRQAGARPVAAQAVRLKK